MGEEKLVEKIKTNFMFNTFFLKSCSLWDNVEIYGTAGRPHMVM